MQGRLFKICLILITLAILFGVATYAWDTVEKHIYWKIQEQERSFDPLQLFE